MADVINLRTARKAKARAAKEAQAAAHRAAFGRTQAQKTSDAAERERRDVLLDGARRD